MEPVLFANFRGSQFLMTEILLPMTPESKTTSGRGEVVRQPGVLHHPWNIRAARVALIVEAASNAPRTGGRDIGQQIDHLVVTTAAIDEPFN